VLTTDLTTTRACFVAGPVVLDVQLQGGTDSFVQQLEHWASTFPAAPGTEPHVHLLLSQSPELQLPTLRSDLSRSPQVIESSATGERKKLEWQYFRAHVDTHRWEAIISARPPALEHIVRAALAHYLLFARGLLFHAATLRFGNLTLLVPGHPNAGKSTLSVEGKPDEVLSNEISIISRDTEGNWTAWPSPFWGSGDTPRSSHPQRLTAAAVLNHDYEQNRWERLSGAGAVVALAPHVGCQTSEQAGSPELLTSLRQLAEDLPVYRFGWLRALDPFEDSPWKRSNP
jgi:hypothetical protein